MICEGQEGQEGQDTKIKLPNRVEKANLYIGWTRTGYYIVTTLGKKREQYKRSYF